MTEEIKTCNNNQKMSVYCKTCVCKSCEQVARLEQENKELKERYSHVLELAKTNADSNEYCLQELEKENKELKGENANLKSLIWYIYCCGEVETIDCIITEYYESRNTQYEKGFWKKVCALKNVPYQSKYKAILEDIREILLEHSCADSHTTKYITDKINEVLQ